MPLRVSSTCAHCEEGKIVLYSLWYHHTVGGRPVHRLREDSSIYLFININQLDALNFIIRLFEASTCFEHNVLIIRRAKLYYTASGIITQVERGLSQPVHRMATYRCDDTRDCIIQFCPPDDEHMCSKHEEA